MNNQENLCEVLAVVLVLNTVWGLYSTGSGSPNEDWGKLVLPLQKQVSLCYTHSTTIIAKIYTLDSAIYSLRLKYTTPDSAIYSLWSQQQVCIPYTCMTPCSAFDLPMHYTIYRYIYIPSLFHHKCWARSCSSHPASYCAIVKLSAFCLVQQTFV